MHPHRGGGLAAARIVLEGAARRVGRPAPTVVATTPASTGEEQARAAVAEGAGLVIAWGGDGTVTAVASGLAGSGVPLGIVPAGTGNLLCRNLGIPLSVDQAAGVALAGDDRAVDLLEVGLGGEVRLCTVIAGIGLDARLIDADEDLKRALGPTAYVVNAGRALRQRAMRVGVAVDGGEPQWYSARTVLVANVGGLVGGLDVVPEADASDGALHVVVLPLVRPVDWARTAGRLVLRRGGHDTSRVHLRGSSAWVVTVGDHPRQVDGDVVAPGHVLQARVLPGRLVVRVPPR